MKKQTTTSTTTTTTLRRYFVYNLKGTIRNIYCFYLMYVYMHSRDSRYGSDALERRNKYKASTSTAATSASHRSLESIRCQYQMRKSIVESDVVKEQLYMQEIEAQLDRLQRSSTKKDIYAEVKAEKLPASESATEPVANQVAPSDESLPHFPGVPTEDSQARFRFVDPKDALWATAIKLHPQNVPLQSLSISQVGQLLETNNLTLYVSTFHKNCVDGVTLAVSQTTHHM